CKSSWPVIGTVTSVTATAPVVSSGGTAPNISMPAATASANGYMTSAYASKLDGIAAGATVGITQAAADTRYVNTTGDVMTDSLTISGGSLVLGPGTDGTISISRSGGRNYFAPYDAGYQYGREFGYDSAIDRWYVENNFTISGCLETGAGCNELFAMNQNVRTFDNPTFATVNTGLGANELYAMNQNVRTTDSPTFVRLRTGGNTDGTSWNVGITGFVIQRSGNVVLGIDSGNVGIGTTNPTQKLDVAGYVRGSSGLCIGNDCRTSWPVSTAPNLQCPPKRVMVDETSANWDEWASYDTCSPTSNYVEFYGTRIYDNGSGLYVDTQASDAWGCIPYCQEFGFSTGQTINSERVQYSYGNYTGRWEKGYVQFPIGQGASKSCRCYP
ncbi:MAG TPA: hypothetical protein DEF27_00380, partial [Oscillatoriales bacterium UBA8482]|nr:hypothetical protein [Oscillatoriales bacterium UBA8482]